MVVQGSFYDVFRLGAKVASHSSGESLGRTEERIATLQVTRVDSKMSYGRLVGGAVAWDDFDKGLIVRPLRATQAAASTAAPAPAATGGVIVEPAEQGGGVRLPFD